MTPKERRDAQIELRDMADAMELRWMHMDGDSLERGQRMDRIRMLRAVAAELDRLPEDA